MTQKHDTGGPDYPMPSGPEPRVNATTHYNEGITLLDYFAGLSMQAIISRASVEALDRNKRDIAAGAFLIAEAMIAEKRRREGGAC